MLALSITLFAITILIGIVLLTFYFLDGKTPRGIARTHGVIATIALIILIISAILTLPHSPFAGTVVLIAAAAAGYIQWRADITKKTLPKWFPIAHAFVAVVGFAALLWFIM